jgi:hypothetical protein
MSGVGLIAAERKRQIKEEGYTVERDNQWVKGVCRDFGTNPERHPLAVCPFQEEEKQSG